MGVKSRIEQSIKRARREGRLDDAADFEQDLIALKARSQAAIERGRKYTVQPGDSYFSIAQEQLGDERWAKNLVQANPELTHLRPGMVIVIPRAHGEAPSFGEQEYIDFEAEYDMEPDLLIEPESEEQSEGAGADTTTKATQTEEAEQPETAPGAMSPEEEDSLVDDLVVLFRALEQQGAGKLPGKKKEPTPTGTPGAPPTLTPTAVPIPTPYGRNQSSSGGTAIPSPKPTAVDTNLPSPQIFVSTATPTPTSTEIPTPDEIVIPDETLATLATAAKEGMPEGSPTISLPDDLLEENFEFIIRASGYVGLDTNELAYVLATAHWESLIGENMYEKYDGGPNEYFAELYFENS